MWRIVAHTITAVGVAALGCDAAPVGSGVAPVASTASSVPNRVKQPAREQPPPEVHRPVQDRSSDSQPQVRLRQLEPATDGKNGRFDGVSVAGDRYRVRLATQLEPTIHQRQLAAYRLARALGLDAVPRTVAQRIPLGELAGLLDDQPAVRSTVAARVSVGNDGAVAALLQRSCTGRRMHVGTGPSFARWAELAASHEPLDPHEQRSVRGYVELVLLDYLTGNVERRFVAYDEPTGRLCLDDNGGAFPGTVTEAAHDLLLERLRPIQRYPRGFSRALEALSPAVARGLLQPGTFAEWLVGPRELTELGERRATLVTLIHALTTRHGSERVLSLEP